ncbi:MAG TPA: protein kinase [Planctomycetota bacterium]|nr:protein kinase [Planctomycetota bacterium]
MTDEEDKLLRLFREIQADPEDEALAPPAALAAEARRDPGRRVGGRFLLLDVVGSGGGGTVWRAWDERLGRLCAVKLLTDPDPERRRRLEREARLAAALSHPAVVSVHEVGPHGDGFYIAMDYIPGRPLDRVDPDPRGLARAAEEIARALQHAHERGVLHRDVTPRNILVDDEGRARLIDFGLARPRDPGGTLTRSGVFAGTPAFVAPEVASGEPASVASDIYGLGASLYAALAGRPPYEGRDLLELLGRLAAEDPPPLRRLNPRVPRELETIVARAMARDPGRRYPSASALADDLRRFLEGRPIEARPPSRLERACRWVRRRPGAAALGAAAAAVLLGGIAAATRASERDLRRLRAEPFLQAGRDALEQAERLFIMADADLTVLDRHLARALELLGRALEERPEDAEGHAARGRAFLLRERPLEAERELSLAIERARTNPSYYLHRAAAREALAERERARSLAEGRGSEDRGWGDAARSDLKQVLVLSPDDIDRKIARARLAFLEGDLAEARRAAREGLRADPNRWEFHFLLGRSTSGEDALAAFQEAHRRRPNDPTLASHLAQLLEETRRPEALEEALALVTRSLARLPGDPQRMGDRARILGKLLRFEEALAEASRMVQAAPEAPYALYQRGQLLLLLDRPDEGTADLERCVRRIPPGVTGWEYFNDLSRAYARRGRWDEVRRCLEEALRRNRDREDRQVDANLGLALLEAPPDAGLGETARGVRGSARFVAAGAGFLAARLLREFFPDPPGSGAALARAAAEGASEAGPFLALAARRLYLGDFDGACSTVPLRFVELPGARREAALFLALARSCRGMKGMYEGGPADWPEMLEAPEDGIAYAARVGRGLVRLLRLRSGSEDTIDAIEEEFRTARRIDPGRPEAPLASGLLAAFRGDAEGAAARLREGVALEPRARDLFGE